MLICGDCGREMQCCKTGKAVYFGAARYAGDEFECPECHQHVIKCNNESVFVPKGKNKGSCFIRGRERDELPWSNDEAALTEMQRCVIK